MPRHSLRGCTERFIGLAAPLRQTVVRAVVPQAKATSAAPTPSVAAPAQLHMASGVEPAAVGHVELLDPARHELDSWFLSPSSSSDSNRLAVIVLNWTLPSLSAKLWQRAMLRVCADGGANRLHDELPSMLPGESAAATRTRFRPDAILGDLDSLRPDVLQFYTQQGVAVKDLSVDQECTDLEKCVAHVREAALARSLDLARMTVVALGGVGGRLDHTLSNLGTLHRFRDMHLVLCGEGNLVRLVPAGRTLLRPCRPVEGPTCGLVPVAGPAVVSSSGVRWNISQTRMEMGGLISTSNILEADEVEVESDVDLVWTTELQELES